MATITIPGMFLTGNHAGRPSSGVGKGTIYACSTHTKLYQTTDTGSTWVDWFAASGTGSGELVASSTIWDAKGDLAAGTGADTASKLTVGSNDQVLTADSAQSTGLKWQVPLPSKAQSGASADTSLSTDTIADVTGCSVSLVAGNWLIWAVYTIDTGSAVYTLGEITDNSNVAVSIGRDVRNSGTPISTPVPPVIVSPGSTTTYKLRCQAGASATVLRYGTSSIPGTTLAAIRVV